MADIARWQYFRMRSQNKVFAMNVTIYIVACVLWCPMSTHKVKSVPAFLSSMSFITLSDDRSAHGVPAFLTRTPAYQLKVIRIGRRTVRGMN